MSESCCPGIAYVLQLYQEEQGRIDTALTQKVHTSKQDGMRGEPLPYQLRSDWMVSSILFICFILVSYVLARGKKHLEQQFKSFTLSKERASLFDDTTASDVRYTLVLIAQTCILSGFCVYDYFLDHNSSLFHHVPHYLLLGLYIGFMMVFIVVKWLIYCYVNWIFFNKSRSVIWIESYFNVIIGAGFLLFPVVLLIVYFDLSPIVTVYFIAAVVIIAKILLFYKCISNFFNNIYGVFHLILYFCGLEIIPDLVLWRGIVIANNILVLNF